MGATVIGRVPVFNTETLRVPVVFGAMFPKDNEPALTVNASTTGEMPVPSKDTVFAPS
jgi:hypothetical protein